MESLVLFFSGLRDPQIERTKAHLFDNTLFIAIASVICGVETWNGMETFGKSKEGWLRSILKLPERDIAFCEDGSRKRTGCAAQNFSVINRIALNLLKNKKNVKNGVKGKRLNAGWNNKYLLKILNIWVRLPCIFIAKIEICIITYIINPKFMLIVKDRFTLF